jgi:hypothetical protein
MPQLPECSRSSGPLLSGPVHISSVRVLLFCPVQSASVLFCHRGDAPGGFEFRWSSEPQVARSNRAGTAEFSRSFAAPAPPSARMLPSICGPTGPGNRCPIPGIAPGNDAISSAGRPRDSITRRQYVSPLETESWRTGWAHQLGPRTSARCGIPLVTRSQLPDRTPKQSALRSLGRG